MRPILFEVPGLGYQVHAFSVLLVLGAAAGVYLTAWRAKRVGINPDVVYELAVWVLGGGFLGARLYYLAQHPESVHSVLDVFKVWQGGIVFYGCIMGGLVGTAIYHRRHPFPFLPMADAVAPALAIGITLGRLGCYLNGCCFGAVCAPDAPWAVTFPAESLPWHRHVDAGWLAPAAARSLPVHPKQLYAAGSGLILLIALTAFYPRRRRDGEVMALIMIGYPITRFLMEFARGDASGWHFGLTVSQYISLGLFAAGLFAWRSLPACPAGLHADRVETVPEFGRPAVARPKLVAGGAVAGGSLIGSKWVGPVVRVAKILAEPPAARFELQEPPAHACCPRIRRRQRQGAPRPVLVRAPRPEG